MVGWRECRLHLLAAALLSAAAPLGAQAVSVQPAPAAQGEPIGRIRGVAFDSLLMKPVTRASVQLLGTGRTAMTDDRGEFSFDDVPTGTQSVALSSPAFDSLGLGVLGATLTVRDRNIVRTTITSPSLATLWNRRCRSGSIVGTDSAIAWGTIRDATDDSLLTGAAASFEWYNLKPGGLALGMKIDEIRRETITDDSGIYFACGLPHDIVISSEAIGKDAASGRLEYAIGDRRVVRVDLVVSSDMVIPDSALLATRDDSLRAERLRGEAALRGRVVDNKGKPLANAIITVANVDTSVRTNKDGEFTLRELPSGTHTLVVRRVGDAPSQQFVHLRPMQTTEALAVMSKVNTLATVNVKSAKIKGRDRIDYEWRRKSGLGYAIDGSVLAQRADVYSAVTSFFPGVLVQRSGFGINLQTLNVSLRGFSCYPSSYLDGLPTPIEMASSMPPENYRAIELYNRPSLIPAEFYQPQACGAILFWSKRAQW